MGLVIAVEPDRTQADILRRAIAKHPGIKLVLVTSAYAANVSMNRQVPDVVLLGDSLKFKQQQEVTAHFRSLAGIPNAPTISIPAPLANAERVIEVLVHTLHRVAQEHRAMLERALPAAAPAIQEPDVFEVDPAPAVPANVSPAQDEEPPLWVDLAGSHSKTPARQAEDDPAAGLMADAVS